MKPKTKVTIGLVAAAGVALGAGYAYSVSNSRPQVGTAEVIRTELVATVSASGVMDASQSMGVYPPAVGTIAKLLVADGVSVAKGDPLAVMDTGPLKLALAQAKAALSAAKAQLEAVNHGVPSAIERSAGDAAISAARSQVSTARKNYAAFLADYRDANSAEKAAMRPTLRNLRTARSTANAALKAAESGRYRLSVAARVGLARTAAKDGIKAGERAVKQAKANLSRAELSAPMDGIVDFVGRVEKGSGVTPGVPVFTVTDPLHLEFHAMVNETDIVGVDKGQAATVTLDAFPQPFTGEVSRVHPNATTSNTGAVVFQVDVAVEIGESKVRAGMSGSTEIATESFPDAVAVPISAVQARGTTRRVFVVGPDSVARAHEVKVGITTDVSAQILSGLSVGDRVVTTGAAALSDGQAVRST